MRYLRRFLWTIEVLRRHGQLPTLAAKARWLYWRHVRWYNGEVCHRCGRPVARSLGSWWHAPDDLWISVGGPAYGITCPSCFCDLADRQNKLVYWTATV